MRNFFNEVFYDNSRKIKLTS